MTLRENLDGSAVYCTLDDEIAREGDLSIRRVRSNPPWFDVWFCDHIHVLGTMNEGEAWAKLLKLNR